MNTDASLLEGFMNTTDITTIPQCDKETKKWKFSELLSEPEVRQRWEKVRKFFFPAGIYL
jgi:hypothetical protein